MSNALPRPEWNRTEHDYPEQLLHEIFEAQATRSPGKPAISFKDETLTYADLNSRINRLAHYLVDLGAGPETLVAVCMERSLEMVIALYAVLKSESAYVPIDPEYPAERIGFMLDDAEAPILLTQERLADRFGRGGARVVAVDSEAARLADRPDADLAPRAAPNSLAYVIYTSGSTGQPKGVMIEHRAIANHIRWMQDTFGLTAADRVLQKVPFSFDLAQWELFWPLLFGAQLVVARPGGHRDSTYLVETIIEQGVTMLHSVPSMLQLLLEHPRVGECTSLKRVLCDGEVLSKALQDRFYERLPAELHNLYGPTEAAVGVTAWACDPASHLSFVPIGKPIANTQIHIVDADLRPVPVGAAGELLIGGVQVARGYLRRPELTTERFVEDTFSDRQGARLYRTGDLARHLADGNLEFLGRNDHQVKIRGFRVELGEIEAAMETVPGIRQAVAVAHERSSGDLDLVAYISGTAADDASVEDLRARLAARLPEYMVPTTFIPVDRFQLTPNGKIDRTALPAPVRDRPNLGVAFVAPRSKLERLIVDKWAQILGIDQIGVHDRFFELGGTSLQAARFAQLMEEALEEPIFVVTLFTAPSAADFAALLESQYPSAVTRLTGAVPIRIRSSRPRPPINEADLDRFRSAVPTVPTSSTQDGERNPPATFILSPPRSGTTLLRVMLAGHPSVFAASELQLLGFETLQERAKAYAGRFSGWLDGAVRSIMEAEGVDADTARARVAAAEAEGLSTKHFYRRLQDAVAPRVLVDKSPSYALDPATLRRAENFFVGARYLHLVRHPKAMIDSFERRHIEQVLYLDEHPFEPSQLAELVWTLSHRIITDFLAGVPAERWMRLRYEDLVADPVPQMEAVCNVLGLAFHPAVLRPYEALESKMVDGVYAESTPMGDPGFVAHGRIDPSLATLTIGSEDPRPLGDPTWEMAIALGYERPDDLSSDRRRHRRSMGRQRELRRTARGSGRE